MNLSVDEFLELTPAELNIKIEAYFEKERDEAFLLWNFGRLLIYTVNDPKNYPKFEEFYVEEDAEVQTVESNEALIEDAKAKNLRGPWDLK